MTGDMTDLPPMPTNPADLLTWVRGLTEEQRLALVQEVRGGSLLGGLAAGGPGDRAAFPDFDRANPEIALPPAPAAPSTYTIRAEIVGAKPPIWRRLAVRSDVTLDVVHRVLQAAFGWWDGHLHRFATGDPYAGPFFVTPEDLDEGETGTPEERARLDQVLTEVGARLTYEYDFGDGWTHRILLESVDPWPEQETRTAWCLTGRRAGPLEDSGGIGAYGELAEWVRNGYDEAHAPYNAEDLAGWIPDGFDPDLFSVEETDEAIEAALLGDVVGIARATGAREELVQLVRRLPTEAAAMATRWLMTSAGTGAAEAVGLETARAATRPWRVLLRHVGDGVALTQAGYLPPAVVQAVYDELGLAERWIGKGNREDLTLPVLGLREQAQELGLLRKAKGRLSPTAAGRRLADDPVGLLKHVAHRLPLGRREDEQQAGWLLLMATAAGERREAADGHVDAVMTALGWRWEGDSRLAAGLGVRSSRPTRIALQCAGGDLVYGRAQEPAPGAVLLARLSLVTA